MGKILIIDDDKEFGKAFAGLLTSRGYEIDYEDNVSNALKKEVETQYDLIIVDLYLGSFTGIQVIELIREHNKKSHVMIMTNSIDDQDEIRALKLGIAEYLRKNTSFSVMLERIKRVLTSTAKIKDESKVITSDEEQLLVDVDNRLVEKNGESIHLTYLEFDLLLMFLKNKNVLLSRENILETVWHLKEEELQIDSRTVDVHIKNLRRKLKISAIHSIRGIGYRWYEK